ncbi:MAG: (E)-4-hydroxy-3-methylbut-2-enyl-diphosphate synthase [Flavobacteriales bacterium]|jgi:(E)-4-hydroxy-3-methylbut-2-enyl-diphosphate synthase|nr:(E)-4-hydroxy-3-methylbut-2-enyl-diphosphate synthase [Flavobacteriales bacterium]MBK6550171.1 (E)-4-hydroxy-3-methylbut-2-enyl-diphosphate synthase [Flavobacteriales bacterium]MBK6881667.1 (E)-4-hydroxy-3-methylbut-2-enyl-diphosphate synthase [Flavobacteriales bacterium]MBK7113415.1 (E)-4-hydroxy-3-methylbut-2-enyl-diphosphate synthase [Flavobacteriales bacterium]MBK7619661.1 (E)-4-hydroxy-3-methylbut-2-enyl-diphosphate synthase [Flavobacteriales bacterium]
MAETTFAPWVYCPSLTRYERWKTRAVRIGDIGIGGDNPIRVQSMTTTDTMDTAGTVAQSIRMIEAGCELVRITAPSKKEAENLAEIKKKLVAAGYKTPLVADIHFTPNAAEIAARIVEKVRVNPGNYADKKKFDVREYSDVQYEAELERIRERFTPLVRICKEHGTAMRIGTNHGSLSDRILNRYGDTPEGMVESAFEFLRICRDENYHEIVLSMKSSNVQVMVQAYRLLVHRMMAQSWDYPLHLGVTEAGDGEDGRVKSAAGIGALLEDGLGDTVRVSLTEEPEFEIPVARALVDRYATRYGHRHIPDVSSSPLLGRGAGGEALDPFSHVRRHTHEVLNMGARHVPVVMADLSAKEKITPATFFAWGYRYSVPLDKWNITDQACDYAYIGTNTIDFEIPGTLGVVQDHATWLLNTSKDRHYPFIQPNDYLNGVEQHPQFNLVYATLPDLDAAFIAKLKSDPSAVLLIDTYNAHGMAEQRRLFLELMERGCETPVIIGHAYGGITKDELVLHSSTDMGPLFLDGFGDGVFVADEDGGREDLVCRTAFGILQATRTRTSKTEYISCPSCGRTLFDLQETTARIRARTSHLKGIKIGIMGCIVNGPGEMADADYGYVGTGVGVITLYKEKEVVKRNVPSEHAVDELIELIRQHGDWVEVTN